MFIVSITLFILATFLGYELIARVPALLHTPLMSGANAISGITVVGAVLASGSGETNLSTMLGLFAVIFATINTVGGFMVTSRMLNMFKKDTRGT